MKNCQEVTHENCIRKWLNLTQFRSNPPRPERSQKKVQSHHFIPKIVAFLSLSKHDWSLQCIFAHHKRIFETNFFRSHFVEVKINIINQKYFINNLFFFLSARLDFGCHGMWLLQVNRDSTKSHHSCSLFLCALLIRTNIFDSF